MACTSYFGAYPDPLSAFGAVSLCFVALKVSTFVLGLGWKILRRQFCVKNFKKYGQWAVVTGCTEGIGKSYALQLAEKGMDVVLISRNPEKLAAVGQQIEDQYKVSVKVIAVDFKRTDIYDKIKAQLKGLDIGVLVNNVGMVDAKSTCYFLESENLEQYIKDIVNVNMLASAMMTGIVLPDMVERKRGAIITISSGAGWRPMPFYTLYSSTKAFLRFFSEALNLEYGSQGVTIQVINPNVVQTNMTDLFHKAGGASHGLFFPESDTFVRAALKTVGLQSCTAAYWPHELQQFIINRLPTSFFQPLLLGGRNKIMAYLKSQ